MSCKFFICGDIINTLGKKDFVDEKLKTIIDESDVSICNLEAPISFKEMKPIKKIGPNISQHESVISTLSNSGFNFVSIANNHIYDYGQEGLVSTLDALQKHKLGYVGGGVDFDEAYNVKIIDQNGVKVGLIAACENEFGCLYEDGLGRGGFAWIFHPLIEDKIRDLKKQVDSVLFIAHAGVEYLDIPIKEWRDRYQRLCDVGVDVLIGHHPHVPQGYEEYEKSAIFYSLGNFYFDSHGFESKSDDSYSVVVDFYEDKNFSYEIVYHKKIDGQTSLVTKEDVNFNLEQLNGLLEDGYEKRSSELCIKVYEKNYRKYYKYALCYSPIEGMKNILRKVLKRKIHDKNMMLLHNIRIDSHRFAVQRALSCLHE